MILFRSLGQPIGEPSLIDQSVDRREQVVRAIGAGRIHRVVEQQ